MGLYFNFWKYSTGPKEKVWMGQIYLYYLPVFTPVKTMEISRVLSGSLQHSPDSGNRKTECKVLRAHFKRKAADDDISARPLMIICSQLTELSEEYLKSADFKSCEANNLLGEMEKYPMLSKSEEESLVALSAIGRILTCKDEWMHGNTIHVNPSCWTWGRFGFHFREIEVCIRETVRWHF